MGAVYKISITALLDSLRQGLSVLVPVVESVGMSWKNGKAYDDWDQIAQALYKSLVVDSIGAHEGFLETAIKLPAYDILQNSYDELSYIRLSGSHLVCSEAIFVGFIGEDTDFSKAAWVDKADKNHQLNTVRFDTCAATLVYQDGKGQQCELTELSILL